jgi:hypothetical protein
VPSDFPQRKFLENKLSADFGRNIKIIAHLPDKVAAVGRQNSNSCHAPF